MKVIRAEVAVVGAGPAGAATALLLARAGRDVVLLDRTDFPRPKACGDCLSPAATAILDRLGVLAELERLAPAHLAGWRLAAPGGEFVARFSGERASHETGTTGLALPRQRLDAALLGAAIRAGTRFQPGSHVTSLIRDRSDAVAGLRIRRADRQAQVRAAVVVGADGLRSVVARRLGLVRRRPLRLKVSFTAHLLAEMAEPLGEMHVGDGVCLGFAPVEPHHGEAQPRLANVTLVLDARRFGRQAAADPARFFAEALGWFPRVCARLRRLPDARSIDLGMAGRRHDLLVSGPFDWPVRRAACAGAVLVGDAAGYFDPFTGQGIFHALAGAEIAAQEVESALRAGDLSARRFDRYAARHRRLVAGGRAFEHLVEWLVSRPTLASAAFRRLGRTPGPATAVVEVAGNLRSTASLLSPRLVLSFLVPRLGMEVRRC